VELIVGGAILAGIGFWLDRVMSKTANVGSTRAAFPTWRITASLFPGLVLIVAGVLVLVGVLPDQPFAIGD
jgi:hypothetical protein